MDRAVVIAASIAFLSAGASAQVSSGQPAQEHVRGDVVSVAGNTVKVKSRSGGMVTLDVANDARVSTVEKASLSDIHDGTFIGTTAVEQPDGTLRAIEVHVFPDSMKGTGEGHRPWDLQPKSSMTNATVSSVSKKSSMTNATVANVAGEKLTLKYSGGEKTVDVTPKTTVVKLEPSDRSKLVPGAHVFAIASKQPDGTLRAQRIVVGQGALQPPM